MQRQKTAKIIESLSCHKTATKVIVVPVVFCRDNDRVCLHWHSRYF